eukprot:GFYU01003729.1.p1 GENE.GFYU01003729.1~~GFYU01003729.1.p1  ORF type:complete len:1078 (-),score=216.65 GFYU01003729.1:197-3391(-)
MLVDLLLTDLTGHKFDPVNTEIDDGESIDNVTAILFSLTEIPPERQFLHAVGWHPNTFRQCPPSTKLSEFGVGSNLHLILGDLSAMVPGQHASLNFRDAVMQIPQQGGSESMKSRMVMGCQQVFQYENPEAQAKARAVIPVSTLIDRAGQGGDGSVRRDQVLKELLYWFKNEFFSWVNNLPCECCGSTDTKAAGGTEPNEEERQHLAGIVELHACNACGWSTRFPRYNSAAKLLETKRGRCGEWAQAFTLCCRSLGYEARLCEDWTDHIWTECWSEEKQKWLHLDSCEQAFDEPLMYESGWGKSLNYIVSFSSEEVIDVTKRYTRKWGEVMTRRTMCSEGWLQQVVQVLDTRIRQSRPQYRQEQLAGRREEELRQFAQDHPVSAGENMPRQSGSLEWRTQRGEMGDSAGNVGSCTVPKPTATQANSKVTAYWPLGRDCQDASGNEFHSSLQNGAAFNVAGLDTASGGFASAENWGDLNISGNTFTVEAWVKPCAISGQAHMNPVVSKHGNGSGYELRLHPDGATFMVTVAGQHIEAVPKPEVSSIKPKVGEWLHVAGVVDFTKKEVLVYSNFVMIGWTKLDVDSFTHATAYDGPLNIGRNPQWNDRRVSGTICQVRISPQRLAPTVFLPKSCTAAVGQMSLATTHVPYRSAELKFDSTNVDGMVKKVLEFNDKCDATKKMTDAETQNFTAVTNMLKEYVKSMSAQKEKEKAPAAPAVPQGGVKELLADHEFPTELRDAGARLVVVDFSAEWCGPCKFVAPQYENLSYEFPDVVFLKVDVDRLQETAAQCGIRAMPTFQLYKNSARVEEVKGAMIDNVKQAIMKHYTPTPAAPAADLDKMILQAMLLSATTAVASTITDSQLSTVKKLMQWDRAQLMPVLDLVRMLMILPQPADLITQSVADVDTLDQILKLQPAETETPLALLQARCIANTLSIKSPQVVQYIDPHFHQMITALQGLIPWKNNNVRRATFAALVNVGRYLAELGRDRDIQQLAAVVKATLTELTTESDDESVYRGIIACGNILTLTAQPLDVLTELKGQMTQLSKNGSLSDKSKSALSEILQLL